MKFIIEKRIYIYKITVYKISHKIQKDGYEKFIEDQCQHLTRYKKVYLSYYKNFNICLIEL